LIDLYSRLAVDMPNENGAQGRTTLSQ
jgi:hypothetical protein